MELVERKDLTKLNKYIRSTWMGNYLLAQEGLNSLDDWGGVEVMREILPREYRDIVDEIQLPFLDVCLKEKNKGIAKVVFRAAQDYFEFIYQGILSGKKVIQHYFPISTEFMWAVDCIPMCFDSLGAISAVFYRDGQEDGIDRLLSEGFPDHLCAAQTGSAGYMLDGLVPKPDIFFKTAAPCDSSNMMYEYVAHKFNVPLVVVDSPYYHNKRGLKFAIDEIKRAIEQLEKITGNTLNEDTLRRHCVWGNQTVEYYLKIEELRKNIPMPDPGWHRPVDTIFLTQVGSPMSAYYFKTLYEELKSMMDRGQRVIPEGKKEHRIAWGYAWMGFDLSFFDWLEEEHGATYCSDMLTYLPADIGLVNTHNVESMIEGIAWRYLNMPMGKQTMGHSDQWVNDFISVVKQYKSDSFVIAGHMACKHFWALNKILTDKIKEETGVPTLRFEVDMLDKRFTSTQEMKRIMSEFMGSR